MRRLSIIGCCGMVLALLGTSCPFAADFDPKARVARLRAFGSEDELREYLVEQVQVNMTSPRSGGGSIFDFLGGVSASDGQAPTADGAEDADSGAAGESSDGFSTTNIQESGVDESDIVKNDGDTLYVLDGNTIHVVAALPPDAVAEIATVDIAPSGDSLYLRGDTLIALSREYSYVYYDFGGPVGAEPAGDTGDAGVATDGVAAPDEGGGTSTGVDVIGGPWFDGVQTTVTFIDVADPASPAVSATVKLEGDLISSRLIDNRLHVVLTSYPRLPDDPTPVALEDMSLDEWLPDYRVEAADGSAVAEGDIVAWPDFYRPEDPDGYGITTVVTLDVDNPSAAPASTAITADAGVIYASTEALYVTDPQYSFDAFDSRTDTIVHKFRFTAAGTQYAASGLVPGRPLNQYSLGEHEDHLRLATTLDTFAADGFSSSNSVYVLAESGTALDIVGELEDIAPGEQIYAARFIGDRGFLVTFVRVDPLFTLDLSDPANPRIAGELKVPGYSDYIHLMDENHLLTIGKDTQDAGGFAWIQGVQLSIFDVTDAANPQLLHKEVIGGRGTSSEANYNPKAFNYFAPLDALAFPIDYYGDEGDGPVFGNHEFTGLYVYRATVESGFERLGTIASSEGVAQNGCFLGYYGYTRGLFNNGHVYAVTQRGVKTASIDDVNTIVGETTFPEAQPLYEDCYYFEDPVFTLPVGEGVR